MQLFCLIPCTWVHHAQYIIRCLAVRHGMSGHVGLKATSLDTLIIKSESTLQAVLWITREDFIIVHVIYITDCVNHKWLEKNFKINNSNHQVHLLSPITKPHPLESCTSHQLNVSRDKDSTTSLNSLSQWLAALSVRKFFLMSNLNLPWCNLRPFPFIQSLVTWEKRSTPSLLQPLLWFPFCFLWTSAWFFFFFVHLQCSCGHCRI